MSLALKRLCAVLCLTLGALLGMIVSLKETKMALADLICSNIIGCAGGDHCGGSGSVNGCTFVCAGGGTVVCGKP